MPALSPFRFVPRALAAAGLLALLASPLHALEPAARPAWPDSFTARLAALALVQSLNAELLSNASATLTLDRWCAAHRLAPEGAKILAERVTGQDKPADAAMREVLKVGPSEPVKYRRVRLRCGERVLSEADNWYVPALLTEDMNRQLDTTDTSFGRVVQPLSFRRQTLSARLLWQPLPAGWEMGAAAPPAGDAPLAVPPFVLEHRAVLSLPDGRPFSALVESYTGGVLAFPWAVGR
ncbi:MAG: hypothetical protein K0S00_418 [Xanthobacteraceae bacterium]|nr:hypothetical protein [Xanthobacteraceae bacterium]